MTEKEIVGYRTELGRNISLCRLSAGYEDGKTMAKRLDVPYTTYMSWERGERFPRTDKLIMMADLFKVSIDTLFSRGDNGISEKFNKLSPQDKLYVYRTIDMLLNKK